MNQNSDFKLHLFTSEFPFGISESYLENEMRVLQTHFNEIAIYPSVSKSELRTLSYEYKLIEPDKKRKRNLLDFIRMFFSSIVWREIRRGPFRRKRIDSILHYYFESKLRADKILKLGILKNEKQVIYYSFWGDEWSLALALLKNKDKISNFVFRVHGYDLYEERHADSFIPFRNFVITQANQIYPVSESGRNYLIQKYPMAEVKTTLFRMGVFDTGKNPMPIEKIVVVSCSNLIPLKRVHLIAQSLVQLKRQLVWHHFGDGRELEKVKVELKNASEIEFIHHGHVVNSELIRFYQKNPVHLFIHVSESEGGVPVSIQEAISFGIPVVATKAGGIAEIVNENTGILLPLNPALEEISLALHRALNDFSTNSDFRKKVRIFWQNNFNAEVNFKKFASHLKNES